MKKLFGLCLLLFCLAGCSSTTIEQNLVGKLVQPTVMVANMASGVVVEINKISDIEEEVWILTAKHAVTVNPTLLIFPTPTELVEPEILDSFLNRNKIPSLPAHPSTRPTSQPAYFDQVPILFSAISRDNKFQLQRTFNAEVYSVAPNTDIALLKVITPTNIATSAVLTSSTSFRYSMGDKLYCCGFPLGRKSPVLTSGILGGYDGIMGIFTGGMTFGNSGGPIFDEQHRVIGISNSIVGTLHYTLWYLGCFEWVNTESFRKLKESPLKVVG